MNSTVLPLSLVLLLPFTLFGGQLESLHQKNNTSPFEPSLKSRTSDEANPEKTEFSEVGLERGPWYFGGAPVYTAIIRSDGSYVYTGIKNGPLLGKHTGHLNTTDIAPLFQFLKEMDYMALDNTYSHMATDQETVYTMATRNGTTKVIRNYGNAGPLRLWVLEKLIDGLLAHAVRKP